MKLKNLIKINQTQKDSAQSTGLIGTHVISPENIYAESQANWSSWTTISGSSTTIAGLKDNNYYQIQVKSTSSNTPLQDYGIVRMSPERNFIIVGFAMGSNANRLSFYKVSSGVWGAYIHVQTGSGFTSLVPSSGFKLRYRRVNL